MKPPSSGPIAAEIAEKPAQVPIALPRSASSNEAPMIASEHGISSAAPAPCTARAPDNCVASVDKSAAERRGREDAGTDDEDAAAAELIAGGAADQQQRVSESV